jgi:BirA family transcriptional regulator, biotin operon repressor / biotin---[acetyl-CoA-carboxylase] ligase
VNAAYIKAQVNGIIGKEIFSYETVGSTNAVAAELSEKISEGAVILAEGQEKGRGRLGRTWISPAGVNIHMSVILRPKMEIRDATLITIMAAVTCATALKKATGLDISIKWPNDLTVSGKKLGGILTDLKTEKGMIHAAIVGIGINVNSDTDTFPGDVNKIATSVKKETGNPSSREDIAIAVLNEMDKWYTILQGGDNNVLLSAWKRLTSTLGKKVVVIVGEETLNGVAEAIDDEGRLLLRLPSGEIKRISSGDLTVLR